MLILLPYKHEKDQGGIYIMFPFNRHLGLFLAE
jgi:hypothetical protein